MDNHPPEDWADKDGWNRYYSGQLESGRIEGDPDMIILRFLKLVQEKGGRVWFPGCGLDPYAYTYASRGCNVLATDFSPVAVEFQRRVAAAWLGSVGPDPKAGTLRVAEGDFVRDAPDGPFDVIVNCRAFQGLSPDSMLAAARNFYSALRPGGTFIADTMNVQGTHRNLMEDCLIEARFYLPYQKSERWYRQQLDSTGIVYGMVMGRPRIPGRGQYPRERFREMAERDQKTLDSFRDEYERRCKDEAAEVKSVVNDPAVKVANVVYATG